MAKRKTGAVKRKGAAASRSRSSARARTREGARKARRSRETNARKAARRSAGRKTARKATARKAVRRKASTARKASRTGAAPRKAAARTRRAPAGPSSSPRRAPTPRAASGSGTVPVRKGAARRAGPTRIAPSLNRPRRIVEDEDGVPTPPSSLDLDRSASAARSGRREMWERSENLTQTGPALTGGDVDADWESAYSVGDEAPGGDNPTPDQDIVDDIGRAVGVQYEDNEELKGEEKIARRDRNRWELDPASAEDYNDRD